MLVVELLLLTLNGFSGRLRCDTRPPELPDEVAAAEAWLRGALWMRGCWKKEVGRCQVVMIIVDGKVDDSDTSHGELNKRKLVDPRCAKECFRSTRLLSLLRQRILYFRRFIISD